MLKLMLKIVLKYMLKLMLKLVLKLPRIVKFYKCHETRVEMRVETDDETRETATYREILQVSC
jgi:hypothetical protein